VDHRRVRLGFQILLQLRQALLQRRAADALRRRLQGQLRAAAQAVQPRAIFAAIAALLSAKPEQA